MQLIGNYLSPYVRRVAISLHELGMPFELQHVLVFDEPDKVRIHNPLARIPALVMDDGEVLVDSAAILDALDQMSGAERALTPPNGTGRRNVMRLTALANGCAEKAQSAFYEVRFRPAEIVHQPWIDHNEGQVVDGFTYFDDLAKAAGGTDWLCGGGKLSQADITAAVSFTFANRVRPNLKLPERVPHLARFAERLEARDSFLSAPLPEPAN